MVTLFTLLLFMDHQFTMVLDMEDMEVEIFNAEVSQTFFKSFFNTGYAPAFGPGYGYGFGGFYG